MPTLESDAALSEYRPEEVVRISDFYKPWPHQKEWHQLPNKHRLAIGSFGSGKSRPLMMEGVAMCIEFPGVECVILRKTVPDLKRTVIAKFESDIPKSVYERGSQEKGTYNKSDHIVYFPPELVEEYDPDTLEPVINPSTGMINKVWRQSKLQFGACEREQDVGKYLSTEYAFVGFEELGEFPFLIYDALEGRNRTTIVGAYPSLRTKKNPKGIGRVFPVMCSVTNPMGIGWGWIKKVFIDKKPCAGMDKDKYNPNDYGYVHSTVDQNPILIKDKAYINSLEKSPLRDKIRWGKLDSVTGQYFDNWDPNRHIRPAKDFIFESWQPTWAAIDYGFGHYSAMIFMTKAVLKPRFDTDKPRMVNVVVRELFMQEKTPEEQVKAFVASIPRVYDKDGEDQGYAEHIESIHLSWERFNRTVENRTVADEMGDLLENAGLPRPTRSNTDRIAGWTKIYSLLESDDLFILKSDGLHRGAPELAEAIPLLVRGDGIKNDIEDVIKPVGVSLHDDLGDAFRYCVFGALYDPEEKPAEQVKREKLDAIKDPLAKQIFGYKEHLREQRERNPGPPGVIVPSWYQRVK